MSRNMEKSNGTNKSHTMKFPTLGSGFWTKTALPKLMCGKKHCVDAKSTCSAKVLVLLCECAAVDFPKFEMKILG